MGSELTALGRRGGWDGWRSPLALDTHCRALQFPLSPGARRGLKHPSGEAPGEGDTGDAGVGLRPAGL